MLKYELKKILGNKFVVFFFILMFAVNAFLSYYAAPLARDELNLPSLLDAETQAKVDAMFERYEADPDTFMADLAERRAYVDKYNEVMIQVIDKNMEAEMLGEEANYTIYDFWPAYNQEIQALIDDYRENYKYFYRVSSYLYQDLPAIYDEIITNAELHRQEYAAFGMSENSYECHYQNDLIDIYSVNKNLPIRIEDRSGWDTYFTYTGGNICLILFLLALVPGLLLDEKKNGTFPIIRATRKGRIALISTKYLTLLLLSAFAVLTFSATTWVIFGVVNGGYSSLTNFVQIFRAYAYCPYIVTVGEYLGLTLLIKILTLFATGSLLLTVSLLLKNHALSYLSGLILGGANFAVYFTGFLDQNNPLRLLNIFTAMDTEVCFSRYYAINICGRCLQYLPAIFIFFGLLLVISAVCTAALYCRTPGVHRARLKKASIRLYLPNRALPGLSRTVVGYEVHKHMVVGKWILLIVAVLLIKGYTVHATEDVFYSFSDTVYMNYMELLEGEVTDEKLAYMLDERANIDYLLSAEAEMKEKYRKKEITFAEYMEFQDDMDTARAKEPIFATVEAQRDYLLALRERGIEGDFVYVTGWNQMFTRSFDYILYAFVLVFGAVLFTTEYSTGMAGILRATKYGRGRLFVAKYVLALAVCGVLAILFCMADHMKMTELYTFTGGLSPVQSLPMLADIKWNITINQYLMIFETLRVLGVLLLTALTVSASVLCKKPVNTMTVVALTTIVPYVFRRFGLGFARYVDFTTLLSGNEYLLLAHSSVLYFILFTLTLIAGCVWLFLWGRRKWVKN